MSRDIYIVGAGTYGEVMYELATTLGYNVRGFYDDKYEDVKSVMDVEVINKFSNLSKDEVKGKQFIVAIGNNNVRFDIMTEINRNGGETPSLTHPSTVISPSAEIGKGVYIQANVYIWTKVKIDDFCIISPGVVIAHHTNVGKACLISTNSGVGASITIEDKVFLGMSTTIVTGLENIGEGSIVGAGAVVLKNVEKKSVYAGVPAKKLKSID